MNAGETSAASRCPEAKKSESCGSSGGLAGTNPPVASSCQSSRAHMAPPSVPSAASSLSPPRKTRSPTRVSPKGRDTSTRRSASNRSTSQNSLAPCSISRSFSSSERPSGVFSNKVIGNWAKISNAVSSRACTDRADSKRQAAHSSIQNPSFIFRSVMRSPRPPAASDATHESTPDHPYPQEKCLFPFSGPVPARQNGRASCP